MTDPREVTRLQAMGLNSWAAGTRHHFIRISPVILTGRHLHADRTRAGFGTRVRRPKVPPNTDLGICPPQTRRGGLGS